MNDCPTCGAALVPFLQPTLPGPDDQPDWTPVYLAVYLADLNGGDQ